MGNINSKTVKLPSWLLAFLVWISLLTMPLPMIVTVRFPDFAKYEHYLFSLTFLLVFGVWLIQMSIRMNVNKLLFVCYSMVVLCMTMMNNGSVMKAMHGIMAMCAYFFLVSIAMKNDKEVFWKHLYIAAIFLLSCNIVAWIANPQGVLYSSDKKDLMYFFNSVNETPNYVIPLLAVLLIRSCQKKMNFLEKLVVCIVGFGNVAMLFLIDCSTAKVAIALFIVMVIFSKTISKVISPKGLYYVYLLLLVLIVFVGVVHWFSFLIVDILGESITLHTRTYAWDFSKEAFKLNPIFGKGYLGADVKYSVLAEYTNGRFSHSHCEFFEILLRSGIVGTVCLNAYLLLVLSKIKKLYRDSKIVQIVVATIFVFLIMSINETCYTTYFYLFVALAEGNELLQIEKE